MMKGPMHERLPPDLERVGDQLVAAAARSLADRERRRARLGRLGAIGVAAILTPAVVLPAAVGPAERPPDALPQLAAQAPIVPAACDPPRHGAVGIRLCSAGEPTVVGRPHRW
jgi:hypothetical protein